MLGEEGVYRAAENPYVDKTPYGWVVDPTGLRLTLRKLYDRYDLPILITENGYGRPDIVEEDRRINDQDRIDYLAKHILAIQAALTDGVDVFGYLPWSAIDVVSTHQGFNKRYGFIYVDRTDENLKELKRIKKRKLLLVSKSNRKKWLSLERTVNLMRVIKTLNNSLILCLDKQGKEVILMGKGIDFN